MGRVGEAITCDQSDRTAKNRCTSSKATIWFERFLRVSFGRCSWAISRRGLAQRILRSRPYTVRTVFLAASWRESYELFEVRQK